MLVGFACRHDVRSVECLPARVRDVDEGHDSRVVRENIDATVYVGRGLDYVIDIVVFCNIGRDDERVAIVARSP